MILWEKSGCSPDWTELLSILADLAKLTEKCSKNCGLLPKYGRDINCYETTRYHRKLYLSYDNLLPVPEK